MFSSGELGGAERSLTRMVVASRTVDVDYAVMTVGGAGAWSDWASYLGLRPVVYACRSGGWRRLSALLRFVRDVASDPPDVYYAIGVPALALGCVAKLFSSRMSIVHGIRSTFPPNSGLATRYAWAERIFGRFIDHRIANSVAGADSYAGISAVDPRQIEVILNGVDVSASTRASKSSGGARIAVVANLAPRKDHLLFLGIVRSVASRFPAARFLFIGRDEMNGAVQQKVEKEGLSRVVEFLGFAEDVPTVLAGADLFCLPSRHSEGAPTAILEAQAVGLPVVVFRAGGAAELVDDGVNGYVIDAGRDEVFVERLCTLLEDRALAARMGEAGRHRVVTEFSIERCAERHAGSFRRVLEGSTDVA